MYIEFGAGKGYLGLALVDAAPGAALVLVDKGTFRLPADRRACCLPACRPLFRAGLIPSPALTRRGTTAYSQRV